MLYPNFLLYKLPGIVDLLGGAADCEHLNIGIRVGWRVPLELNPRSRLLTDALDCLTA